MILRLSTKLAAKLKLSPEQVLPLDPNPFVDWSAHLFTAERMQFVLVTNTASLYSTVLIGREITNDSHFIKRVLSAISEFMEDDGQAFIYQRFIAPASGKIAFSKALNRSVTSSMNDLIIHAKIWLTEGELSPHDTGFKLNGIPFSQFKYRQPREVFTGLLNESDREAIDH